MRNVLMSIVGIILIVSAAMPSAAAFSLTDITKPVGLIASDATHFLRQSLNGFQAWFFLYILGNTDYHSYLVTQMAKDDALHELFRQRTNDPNCCRSSECILDKTAICTEMCVDCNTVEQEIIQHFNIQ